MRDSLESAMRTLTCLRPRGAPVVMRQDEADALSAEIAKLRAELEEARARLVCVHDAVKQNKSLDLIRVEVGYWLTCDAAIIRQAALEMDAARERK